MGWVYSTAWPKRKYLIAERIQREEHNNIRWICLKHCFRGNAWKGVLWTVWEVIKLNPDTGEVIETDRYIGCDLIEWSNREPASFGVKDMSEECGPYYYSCPLSYLDMVPVANQKWRDGVQSYHATRKPKFKLRIGQKVKMTDGCNIKTAVITETRPIRGLGEDGRTYKLKWKYIEASLIQT